MQHEIYTAFHEAGHIVIGHVLGLRSAPRPSFPMQEVMAAFLSKARWRHATNRTIAAAIITRGTMLDRSIVPTSWKRWLDARPPNYVAAPAATLSATATIFGKSRI